MLNVNCTAYKDGRCLHQAAPRKVFGYALCVIAFPPKDVRLYGCQLKTSVYPDAPSPPPSWRHPRQGG